MSQLASRLDDSGEIQLELYNQGEKDGFMRLGWHRKDGVIELYDRTMMPSLEIYETMEATLNAANFTPGSLSIRFFRGTALMSIEAQFEPGKVNGEHRVERPGQSPDVNPIDTETPQDVILRAVTFLLPLVASQEPGASLSFTWYAPLGNAVQSVTLTARDGGVVETPAGEFETVCYELRGGSPENDIYLSRGDNPNIVRIDVVGQPLQFLAPAPQG